MNGDSNEVDELWAMARNAQSVSVESLSEPVRCCVSEGDGLADHYGGRAPFVFIEQRKDRLLVLERPAAGAARAKVFEVINCTGGYGTGILGSQVDLLRDSMNRALDTCPIANDEFHSPERQRLISKLRGSIAEHTRSAPGDWELTFTSTGTEAMDLAMQLVHLDGYDLATGKNARQERDVLIACHGAWHGWGQNPNQLLDRRQFTDGLPRLNGPRVVFMRYGDLASLDDVFDANRGHVRGVFVEGMLGDGGVVKASDRWWQRLFEATLAEGAKLVDDEILTGFRCGGILALPKGLAPDCITLGKALGLGLFPVSAVLWRKSRLRLRPGVGVRTFNARPFQSNILVAAMELFESQNLFERSRLLGEEILARLVDLAERHSHLFKAARGAGFFFGLELAERHARRGHHVRNTLLRHGVLTEVESGLFNPRVPRHARINETIRLTPPLGMPREELLEVIARMDRAAQAILDQDVAA